MSCSCCPPASSRSRVRGANEWHNTFATIRAWTDYARFRAALRAPPPVLVELAGTAAATAICARAISTRPPSAITSTSSGSPIEQLRRLADQARAGGLGLYLDFPLGVNADSYDVWRDRASFAQGISAGAPPDSFFTKGQDWGFPPLHPGAHPQ